jgi:SAM-dependent methyltransferase
MSASGSSTSGKPCLWCAGETSVRYHLPRILDHSDHSGPYEIRWCKPCDFGFLDPRPSDQEFDRLNDRAKGTLEVAQPVPTFLEKVRLHLAWRMGHALARQIDAPMIHSIAARPHAAICIFGREHGALMRALRELGHDVLAVENGSADAPPSELFQTSFDVVFLSGVLAASLEPRAALLNAHRLLKPGGHLLVEVSNHAADLARRAGPTWSLCDAGRNVNFFTGESLSRFVESTGYDVNDMLYRQIVPQFSRSRIVAQREIANRLGGDSPRIRSPNALIDPWIRLLRLAFQSPAQRFEIVAVIATKRLE